MENSVESHPQNPEFNSNNKPFAIFLIKEYIVLKCNSSERQCRLNYQNPFSNKKVMLL